MKVREVVVKLSDDDVSKDIGLQSYGKENESFASTFQVWPDGKLECLSGGDDFTRNPIFGTVRSAVENETCASLKVVFLMHGFTLMDNVES